MHYVVCVVACYVFTSVLVICSMNETGFSLHQQTDKTYANLQDAIYFASLQCTCRQE